MYREKSDLRGSKNLSANLPKEIYALPQVGRAGTAAKGVVWAALNSIVPSIITAAVFTISSRFLAPAEFGLVALSSGIAAFAGSFSPAGFGQALIQRKNLEKIHADTVFWLCLGCAAILYLVLLSVAPIVASSLNEPDLFLLVSVLGIRVVFDLCAVVPNAFLVRTMSFKRLAIRSVLGAAFGGGVCLLLIAEGYTIWALVFAQLATSFTLCAASFLAIRWKPGFSWNWSALSDLKSIGGYSSGHRFFNQLSLDQILIGATLGAAALGTYAFAKRIFQLLNDAIAGAFGNVSYALLSSLQAEEKKLREAFLLSTFASAALAFPIFIGLAIVSETAVPMLFGAQWIEAIPALQLFCFIGVLSCIGMVQGSLINSQGQARWWFWYIGLKQLVSVVSIALLYRFGIVPLMLALCGIAACFWPFAVARVSAILGMSWRTYLSSFSAPLLASIAMFPAIGLVNSSIEATPLGLIFQIIIGAATYTGLMTALSHKTLLSIYNLLIRKRQKVQ